MERGGSILRSRNSEQLWSIPRSQPTLEYTPGNVFENLPAREGPSSALFENSRNLASSSCRLGPRNSGNIMEHGRGKRREPQSSTPRFNQAIATLNPLYHTGGTYSHNGVMDYMRFTISEMHLGKFPDSLEFQSWKVNFKTEVCSKRAVLISQCTGSKKLI